MVAEQLYRPLDREIPTHPPEYDDVEEANLLNTETPNIEQFEIEEDIDNGADGLFNDRTRRESFMVRAGIMTKKFATNFNVTVLRPVLKIIDPMHEGYKYFQTKYEQCVMKIGNPLVVKRLLYVFFILILIFFVTKNSDDDGIKGVSGGAFSNGRFYDREKLFEVFNESIDPRLMKQNLHYLSLMPHIAGTKGDLTLTKYVESYMKNNGLQKVVIEEFQSFINYPIFDTSKTYLKLADNSYEAKLFEANNQDLQFLSINPNSLSTDEEIEAHYHFVNYGTTADFAKMNQENIDLENSILFIRYGGGIPEANKVSLAQKAKAIAVVFITDKLEVNSETFENYISKVNVGLTRVSPGDILTPGWSSDGYSSRLPWFKSTVTPKIPTIPISWNDGKIFLSKLNSGVKFDNFYSGNGKVKVKLRIDNNDRATQPIWNVVGTIQGREQADRGIIIGAGRDSSCYGTMSTNTGTVILLELIKALTLVQRKFNWSPSRSITFASWDASEYNFAGSSEWIENKREILKSEGYTYIDLSDVVSGDQLLIKSHPFLHNVIKHALEKVKNDDASNLLDLFKLQNDGSDLISNNMIEDKNYIPFINSMNIPSMEIKFLGVNYPKHSCFDTFLFFEKSNIDVDMQKHRKMVELLGLIILDLAESPLIPYSFTNYNNYLIDAIKDLEKYASNIINNLEQINKPIIHFDRLYGAVEDNKKAGNEYELFHKGWTQYIEESGSMEPSLFAMKRWKWNENVINFNLRFLAKHMDLNRPGYANKLLGVSFSAPNTPNDEYQWNTFPSIRDLLDTHQFGEAQHEIDGVANMITNAAYKLRTYFS